MFHLSSYQELINNSLVKPQELPCLKYYKLLPYIDSLNLASGDHLNLNINALRNAQNNSNFALILIPLNC